MEKELYDSSAGEPRTAPFKLLLTRQECAAATGLSLRSIDFYIQSGELVSRKFGKSRRVHVDALRVFCRRSHTSAKK